jgi:hypothetical protein
MSERREREVEIGAIVLLMMLTVTFLFLILLWAIRYPVVTPSNTPTSTSTSSTTTTTTPPPTTTMNYSSSGSYNAVEEQSLAASYGENVPITWFSCTSSSDCTDVLAATCDNNIPSQHICINSKYYGAFESEHNSTFQNSTHVCPLYFMNSNITCSCAENYCTENYSFG